MAILLPQFGSCRWDSSGERRFAERLLSNLEDDYLCWHNVPVGAARMHPDFVLMHPRRGILVLEIKDWKLETIQTISKNSVTLLTNHGAVVVANPLEQSRQYVMSIIRLLQRDPQLCQPAEARYAGKLALPWGYGLVLTNIVRKQFDMTDLGDVLSAELVICRDEMLESTDSEAFQQRLWAMFPKPFPCLLSLPQIERVRWHLYPDVRVHEKVRDIFAGEAREDESLEAIPDLIRVMDMNQEQLARSLGEGHRIIHGVAGSGKTMILGYRCQYLARTADKPVLVLCYNKALAANLESLMAEKGLGEKIAVRHFHRWCREQLISFHVPLPAVKKESEFSEDLVQTVVDGVERGHIPSAQYSAVLIDEGHDFEAMWLRLVVQMIDPKSNSLLVLYDDAQSLYGKSKRTVFSFSQLGIQARGRTTILKLNYRNTAEVLSVAYEFAREVMTAVEAEEDSIPLIKPQSAGRHGPLPMLTCLSGVQQEVRYVVDRLCELHRSGTPWRDMAVLYRFNQAGERLSEELRKADIPVVFLGRTGPQARSNMQQDAVRLMTMHASKGLEFPVAIVTGVGDMPFHRSEVADEARLLYVAMTRAMHQLELTSHRDSVFANKLADAIGKVA